MFLLFTSYDIYLSSSNTTKLYVLEYILRTSVLKIQNHQNALKSDLKLGCHQMMEIFNSRIPHVSEQIFEQLDSKSIANFREVAKSWKKIIANKKST